MIDDVSASVCFEVFCLVPVCDWLASQADGLKVYDDNGMHLELGILMQPGKHVLAQNQWNCCRSRFGPAS